MAGLEFTKRDLILRYIALIFGSLIFSFPFYWLVVTSWKGEKELFAFPPTLFPELPVSTDSSPYIHPSAFPPVPLNMEADEATRFKDAVWQKASALLQESGIEPWEEWGMNEPLLREEMLNGVLKRTMASIPAEEWNAPYDRRLEAFFKRLDLERIRNVWNEVRKEFLVGKVRVVTYEGVDIPLEPVGPWQTSDGVQLRSLERKGEQYERIRYDFKQGDSYTCSRLYRSDELTGEPMFWSAQFRYDNSHHRVKLHLSGAGYELQMKRAVWLDSDQFYEIKMHRPGVRGDVYDYEVIPAVGDSSGPMEPGIFRLTLTLTPSNPAERIYGKFSRNYRLALAAFPFNRFIWNSVYLVVLNVLGQMLSCAFIAYGFARLRWPGREVWFLILLSTMMLPPQVTTIPVFLIFKYLGWYNTLKPLWIPAFFGTPFFIFLLRQFFLGIPRDLEEAAYIDGCGYLRTFTTIMVPLIRPALAAIAIFQFMYTWNDFFGPLIFTNDMDIAPLPLGLFIFRSSVQGQDYGMLMAVTTVMTLPVIALFFMAQRYFIQGITLTGLKG